MTRALLVALLVLAVLVLGVVLTVVLQISTGRLVKRTAARRHRDAWRTGSAIRQSPRWSVRPPRPELLNGEEREPLSPLAQLDAWRTGRATTARHSRSHDHWQPIVSRDQDGRR